MITTISYFQTTCKNIPEEYFPIEKLQNNLSFQVKISHRLQKLKHQIPRF